MKAVKFDGEEVKGGDAIWVVVDNVSYIQRWSWEETNIVMPGIGKIRLLISIDDVMTRLGFNTGGG